MNDKQYHSLLNKIFIKAGKEMDKAHVHCYHWVDDPDCEGLRDKRQVLMCCKCHTMAYKNESWGNG